MWQIKQESFLRKTPSWTSWYCAMNQEHQLDYIKMKTYQKTPLREWRGKHKNVKENLPIIHALNTHQTARMKELMRPHTREPLIAQTLQVVQSGTNTTRCSVYWGWSNAHHYLSLLWTHLIGMYTDLHPKNKQGYSGQHLKN